MSAIFQRKQHRTNGAAVLPLQSGDSMTSAEFLRRAELCDEDERAELIDGIVFMQPPLSFEHSESDGLLGSWLGLYAMHNQSVWYLPNTTLVLDADSTVQPDSILCTKPDRGGSVRLSGKYLSGSPELVCEIATSSVSLDLHRKLHIYRRCGVREYLVWRTHENELDWFVNTAGNLVPQSLGTSGLLKSTVFEGLVLNVKALLARDSAGVRVTLEKALTRRAKRKK